MIPINTASHLFSKSSVSLTQVDGALADLNLRVGDVVEGKVLKQTDPGSILLLIQGKKIKAHTRVPLKAGMRLSLKFSSDIGMPSLKILDANSPQGRTVNLAAVRTAIDENLWARIYKDLDDAALSSNIHKKIKALMTKASQMMLTRPDKEGLAALVDAFGFSWETKLARLASGMDMGADTVDSLVQGDLKGLIAKSLMNPGVSDTILTPLFEAMDNIQLLNVPGNEQTRSVFLPLPLQFESGVMVLAQILFQFPREDVPGSSEGKEEKQDQEYSVVMLLEMTTLGAIRAELVLTGKTVQGRFVVEKKSTAESIETQLHSFSSMLENRGFTIGYMGCSVADKGIVRQSPVQDLFPRKGSSVCFVA